ncbi:ribbon-helix-helix domain-containing protein [Pseudomonas sp. CFBP 8770]|uniref:ribbon-helix-helix domain-containing protein n=1 Tax=unclassified Pseudomonas TaxID=196821 RepID=UPI00178366EE|nr:MULTISPECIES: ribbon-helix-helix domain-containing protein [unclassified Pseudomonas]MBD8475318.1 ribbon-helix-helix domain-containing protein [Pseudomonas sp. CFBP 8773]MBD8645419.1 ribbon-helix-helix domain-containing protein [Pseudomonas sp. CFBP 8770]MBD8680765.1 ribbon-helix-helix domain-containing protein [Pseudomonas sp. CFBP 13719]
MERNLVVTRARQLDRSSKLVIDPYSENFDMGLARPVSRSVRLNGFATCLRLERVYWEILERIALVNECTVNALLSYVDREVHLRHGGVKNFSGLVRVVCVTYLMGRDRTSSVTLDGCAASINRI